MLVTPSSPFKVAPDYAKLMERLAKLEKSQKPTVDHLKKSIIQYALRQATDFDKYEALQKIEQLKVISRELKDKKADFFASVYATLLERVNRPNSHFKDYVLSLLGDRDYEKIMEAVTKIDKNFEDKKPAWGSQVSQHPLPPLRYNNVAYLPPPHSLAGPPVFPIYNQNPPAPIPSMQRPLFPNPRRPMGLFCSYCKMNNHNINNCFRRRRFNPYPFQRMNHPNMSR